MDYALIGFHFSAQSPIWNDFPRLPETSNDSCSINVIVNSLERIEIYFLTCISITIKMIMNSMRKKAAKILFKGKTILWSMSWTLK